MSHTLDHLLLAMQQHEQSSEIFSTLLRQWIEHTANALGGTLSQSGADGRGKTELIDALLASYQRLDPVARSRFLLSPEVSSYLEDPDGMAFDGDLPGSTSLLTAVRDAARRELAMSLIREGDVPDIEGSHLESPLSDLIADREPDGWTVRARQKIADVVVLDVDSRLSLRHEPDSGTFCQPRLEVTLAEQNLIAEKLERAMELIEAATPIFALMVKSFTRRIIVRKSVEIDEDLERVPLGSEYRPYWLHSHTERASPRDDRGPVRGSDPARIHAQLPSGL